MYEDYAIKEQLFHWQTQSTVSDDSTTAKRYFNHKSEGGFISMLVREYKKYGQYTSSFTYLGNADYVNHSVSKSVSIVWNLHESIPASLRQKANKSVAI